MRSVGVGLRASHYESWLGGQLRAPAYVEAITENVLGRGGRPRAVLERVRAEGDLFLHGVSLSIGSVEPLDEAYVSALSLLASDIAPRFVSDHVSFGRVGGVSGHDLWPLPLTEETLRHLAARVAHVQDRLGRRIALENVSSYLATHEDTFEEADFLVELAARTDCLLLVDVNNVVVSAHNHRFDALRYLQRIPKERVAYLHVAGHSVRNGYRFDDHSSLPNEEVRARLRDAFALYGEVPCIFEWDEGLPHLVGYLSAAQSLGAEAA